MAVDPEKVADVLIPNSYLPALALVFGGFFWLLSILFMSAKRALRWSVGIAIFLSLRIHGYGSVLNGALILGVIIMSDYYFGGIKEVDADFTEQTKQND